MAFDTAGVVVPVVQGGLRHLNTRNEIRSRDETIEVYIAEIPRRQASNVLNAIKTIPGQPPLLHLRRFAKYDTVPDHIRNATRPPWKWRGHASIDPSAPKPALPSLPSTTPPSSPPLPLSESSVQSQESPQTNGDEPELNPKPEETMHTLLCPTDLISVSDLEDLIRTSLDYPGAPLSIASIVVPKHPPISSEMAAEKSKQFWPTVYMNGNPFGPHPSAVSRATAELSGEEGEDIAHMMALASTLGQEAHANRDGEDVGVVVVERSKDVNGKCRGAPKIVVVAGDGRYCGPCRDGKGNPGSHAIMRAIALVARKRRKVAGQHLHDQEDPVFADMPRTQFEQLMFDQDNLAPNGYLCLDLEFYTTHEPCTMCSMALVHSRVGRLVFGKRMKATGGISSEVDNDAECEEHRGLGYGLFWREDLNWRFLGWQWQQEHASNGGVAPSQPPYHV